MSRMTAGTVRAMRPLHLTRRTLRTLLPLLMTALAACQGAQQRFDDAARAYDAEDWSKAYDDASAAQTEAQPPLRQRAALYAGQAALRMKRLDDAQARLTVAETSPEPTVAGQAKMALGHVLVEMNRPGDAKLKYLEAAQLLPAPLSGEARREADAAGALAAPPAAAPPTRVAAAEDDDTAPEPPARARPAAGKARTPAKPPAKPRSDDAPKSGSKSGSAKSATAKSSASKSDGDAKSGFTIQAGAYVRESDARARAKDLADEARRAGLPAPKVQRVTGRDGKRLWIVTIGQFKSRADGKKALAKLKVDHAEVLPAIG